MPCRRRPPQEDETLLGQGAVRCAHGSQDSGQHHGAGALDVVVEARDPVAVSIEDADGVVLLEVLPLQDCPWGRRRGPRRRRPRGSRRTRAAKAVLAVADVRGIGQQVLVVGAHVERHRQRMSRVDARAGGVEGQLADRDAHAARALVAQAQDPLVVGGDDQANVGHANAGGRVESGRALRSRSGMRSRCRPE
jgi:hypothetical protein